MPTIIMCAPLDLPGAYLQQRLRMVQGLDLRFLIHTKHKGLVGRMEVAADNIADLVDEERIGGELEGLSTMGLQSEDPPMRCTVLRHRPLAWAMPRMLQCVAPGGVASKVCVMTRSTSWSVTVRAAPGLGLSSRPSRRVATNRWRHLQTVC